MGSNGGEPMVTCEKNAAECSATTVEIKIKTLDSRTFTLRVDKRVPVPELKEQIASVTGVLSDQQRLICRGKVLKDDQLLSAYQVEDGHTLHLVVRQPVAPMSESSFDQTADPTSSAERNGSGPGMFVGTFSLPDQGDGSVPDLSRIVSAVLNSFGLSRFESAGEGIDLNQPPSQRGSAPTAVPGEAVQQPIIPDSLTTLIQYSSHLRQEFINVGGSQNVNSESAANISDSESRRLLTPEYLAEAMSSVRQLISAQASESLSQLAGQLNSQASITDPSERSRIQSNAIRTGSIFQNLGSLLLELGRAITTLRMGQSPADALVNAGPSVFVSSTRPNPIMVQPLQAGASFGSVPIGTAQQGSSSGFVPRNIDIRIRTGSAFSRRERSTSPVQGQGAPPASGQQDSSEPDSNSQNRDPQVQRALPFRTVVVPHGSDSSSHGGPRGILIPVMTRVQHVVSASPFVTRTPSGGYSTEQPNTPDSASQPQNTGSSGLSGEALDPATAQFRSSLERFIGSMFGEPPHVVHNDAAALGSVQGDPPAATEATGSTQEAASEEGILLSNMLQQIMPLISQNIESEPNGTHDVENQEQRSSSRHEADSESQPNPKRQRRE